MKKFVLIFKNNWENIRKLRVVFILLSLIVVLFSTSFTLFWEFNRQFRLNIKNSHLTSSNFDFFKRYEENVTSSTNAFCTAFKTVYDDHKKEKRRLSILTFGGEEGCFKAPDVDKFIFTFKFADEFQPLTNRRRIVSISDIHIPDQVLEINQKSRFYQASIHGLLRKKFVDTGNEKFLQHAKYLERYFFSDYLKYYSSKLRQFLNQKLLEQPVYTTLTKKKVSYSQFYRHFANSTPSILSEKLLINFGDKIINSLVLTNNKRFNHYFANDNDYTAARRKTKLFLDRVQKLKNFDENVWQQIYQINFQDLINEVVEYTSKYLPKNEENLIKFAYKKEKINWNDLKEFRVPYIVRWDLDFDDSIFLRKANINLVLQIIKASLENKEQFLLKNQKNTYFLNLSKYLFTRLHRAKALLIDLLEGILPGFKIYKKIKYAHTYQNYGTSKEEQLRYFNFNNLTLNELWKQKQFNFPSNHYLFTLLDQIESRYLAWKKINFFQTYQTELQSLETSFFNNTTRSQKIIIELGNKPIDSLNLQGLLDIYFWNLTAQMVEQKNTYTKLNKFFGVALADFDGDQSAFQTFQNLLTTSFSLDNDFIKNFTNGLDFFSKWTQFVAKLKTVNNKIIARVLAAQNQRAWLIADNGLALKTATEVKKAANLFNQIVDPYQRRMDQWQIFQNYIALNLIKQAKESNPQTTSLDPKEVAYFSWSKLLEDSLFQKYFRNFYYGLTSLTDAQYQTFLSDLESLKQTNFNLNKTLILDAAKEAVKTSQKNLYFRFAYKDQSYGKPFSQFVEELEAGKIDDSIKEYGGYLLARLYYWLFITEWEYQKTGLIRYFSQVDYFKFAYQIQNIVLSTLNWLPKDNPIPQIKNNIVKIQAFYNQILSRNYLIYRQDPTEKFSSIFEEEQPLLKDRLKTLKILEELKTSLIVDNVTIDNLFVNYQNFEIPAFLKHWINIFTTERQKFSNLRINKAQKQLLLDKVATTTPFSVFEETTKLLKTPIGDVPSNLNDVIFNYNAFFDQFRSQFITNLKAFLPSAFQNKFIVNVLDNDKTFSVSYSPQRIIKAFATLTNLKREFRNQYYSITFETDVNFNISKHFQTAFNQTVEYWKSQFTDQFKSFKYNWITNIETWKITNGLHQTFPNAYFKNPITSKIVTKTAAIKAETKWNEIVAFLMGIDLQPLKFLYFQNSKTNETFLLISKSNAKLYLHEGYEPQFANEVVISPLYANYKNIAVGDSVSFIGVDNFKITGIGTSNKFVYPALNYVDLIPRKDSNIVYVDEGFFISNTIIRLKESLASNFWFLNEYFFYNQDDNLPEQTRNQNYQRFFGYTSNTVLSQTKLGRQFPNYTAFLESLFPEYDELGAEYSIKDQKFINLKQAQSIIPFTLNTLIPQTIYQVVFYVFLYIVIVLGLIVIFAIVHLFTKKIEINRWQFGILKALGFGNWYILLSLISFTIFLIVGTFCGWIIGTILQKPFFTLFTDKILFTFDYFYFNYHAFYICLGLFVFFLIMALVFYNFRTFNRLSAIRFMSQSNLAMRKQSEKIFSTWIKKRIINPFWKINYILFDTIGKKIFFLFLIVLLIATNFIGVVLFVSAFYKTESQLQADQEVKWIFQYRSPVRGHPISKLQFFTNRGAQAIWNKGVDDVTPTQNLSGEAYLLQTDGSFKKQKMTLTEILSYLQVLHNKSLNYKKINQLLKEGQDENLNLKQDDFKRYVCNIVKNIFEKAEIDSVNCLESILNRAIPFTEFANPAREKTAKEHFPISFNGVAYNPEKDQLHTLIRANIANQEENFDLHGFAAKNRFLELNSNLAERFYIPSSDKTSKVIPLIVNQIFADRMKKKVGDRFGLEVAYKQAILYDDVSKKNIPLKDQNWFYYAKAAQTNQIEKIPYTDLPYDVQFYHGSFLINANKNLSAPDKYRIQNNKKDNADLKTIEKFDEITNKWVNYEPYYQTQRNGKTQYLKYVNVDNIVLEVGEYVYYPFRFTKESEGRIKKEANIKVWWNNGKFKIEEQKKLLKNPDILPYQFEIIHIYPGFDQAEAYLSQPFLNTLIWDNDLQTDKYANSKETINPLAYFNVRYSPFVETYNALYNFALINGLNYVDFSSIGIERQPIIFKLRNIGLERKYRIAFLQFGFKIIWILILFNLLTLVFLFGLMTKIIFDIFQSNTLLLRILGYSNLEISTQIFVIMLTPIATAFLIASFVTKALIDMFLQYLIDNYQIYIFYISDFWIFLVCFSFFFILWLGIYFFYMKTIKKINIANRLKIL